MFDLIPHGWVIFMALLTYICKDIREPFRKQASTFFGANRFIMHVNIAQRSQSVYGVFKLKSYKIFFLTFSPSKMKVSIKYLVKSFVYANFSLRLH